MKRLHSLTLMMSFSIVPNCEAPKSLYAKKEIKVKESDGSTHFSLLFNHRYSWQEDCFERSLFLQYTGGETDILTANTWVALEKSSIRFSLTSNYLFSKQKPSTSQMIVESALIESCRLWQSLNTHLIGSHFEDLDSPVQLGLLLIHI